MEKRSEARTETTVRETRTTDSVYIHDSIYVREGGDRWTGQRRELLAVDLLEISVVHSWPAYSGTTVEPRTRRAALARARLFLETV